MSNKLDKSDIRVIGGGYKFCDMINWIDIMCRFFGGQNKILLNSGSHFFEN